MVLILIISPTFFFFCFFGQNSHSTSLELDLEKYVIPAPSASASGMAYAANSTVTPRSLKWQGIFPNGHESNSVLQCNKVGGSPVDQLASIKVCLGNPSCLLFVISYKYYGDIGGRISVLVSTNCFFL